jgi:hypothetical protein
MQAQATAKSATLAPWSKCWLERLLTQEQVALLPEQDTSDVAVVDLRTPLDHAIDPVQAAKALERTRISLLERAMDINDTRRHVNSTVRGFYAVQGTVLAGEVRGPRRDHGPPLWIQASLRHSGRRLRTKAKRSAARAPVLQARIVEDTAPSAPAATAGIGGPQILQSGQKVRPASWLALT